ncbi:hypothetical protein EYF80_065203 [Liparis tanakae]|uniref:Uncharacterized protein n=1 Tax=Liparis tanakae TaxID=230148 RepID=A0A4Z2E7D7_9TELE|nr:hypothetical protein EYF80_065203 [Liparis tanakae]
MYFLSGKRSGILILWKSWMHFSSSSSTDGFSLAGLFLLVLVSRELARRHGALLGGPVQGLDVGVGVRARLADAAADADRAADDRPLGGAGFRLAVGAGGGELVEGGRSSRREKRDGETKRDKLSRRAKKDKERGAEGRSAFVSDFHLEQSDGCCSRTREEPQRADGSLL